MNTKTLELIREAIRVSLIIEGRIDDAKRKYPDLGNKLDRLVQADPSGNQKYLAWMANQASLDYNVDTMIEYIKKFHDAVQSKKLTGVETDINSYEHLGKLVDKIYDLPKYTRSQLKKKAKKDSKKVYNDGKYLVISPESTEASCYYGYGTKWCISANEKNYFDNYTSQGVKFYFVIDKTKPPKDKTSKIAIAVTEQGIQVYDTKDDIMTVRSLKEKLDPNVRWDIAKSIMDHAGPRYEKYLVEFLSWNTGSVLELIKNEDFGVVFKLLAANKEIINDREVQEALVKTVKGLYMASYYIDELHNPNIAYSALDRLEEDISAGDSSIMSKLDISDWLEKIVDHRYLDSELTSRTVNIIADHFPDEELEQHHIRRLIGNLFKKGKFTSESVQKLYSKASLNKKLKTKVIRNLVFQGDAYSLRTLLPSFEDSETFEFLDFVRKRTDTKIYRELPFNYLQGLAGLVIKIARNSEGELKEKAEEVSAILKERVAKRIESIGRK